jgi:predicted transcriptional regulator
MQERETYTLQELFDYLPITLVQLSKESGINEVTLARMRDGEKTRRDTVNKLMIALSRVYGRNLSLANVTGINVMVNKRLEKKAARQSGQPQGNESSVA